MNKVRQSMMAGVAISLGCIAYLKVGGVVGAVLFTFGLLTVVHYQLPLYTGQAGFVSIKRWYLLAQILLGNLVGCFITAVLAIMAFPDLIPLCDAIAWKHLAMGHWQVLTLGIGCGFIMTIAVEFARKRQYLPLLFGVPLFILCGFQHSVADSFYYFITVRYITWHLWDNWLLIVLGNYLGCNAYKLFINYKNNR